MKIKHKKIPLTKGHVANIFERTFPKNWIAFVVITKSYSKKKCNVGQKDFENSTLSKKILAIVNSLGKSP
jgi:hypothetical protein